MNGQKHAASRIIAAPTPKPTPVRPPNFKPTWAADSSANAPTRAAQDALPSAPRARSTEMKIDFTALAKVQTTRATRQYRASSYLVPKMDNTGPARIGAPTAAATETTTESRTAGLRPAGNCRGTSR